MTQILTILRRTAPALLIAALLLTSLAGCSSTPTANAGPIDMSKLKLDTSAELPDYLQDTRPEMQEAYRFALANREILEKIPCYCGCNTLGHKNNYDCYVNMQEASGFEPHAAY